MASRQVPRKRKKKRRIRPAALILVALLAVAVCGGIYALYKTMNPVSLVSSVYTAEYQQPFNTKGNLKSVFMDTTDKVTFEGSVDTSTISTSECAYVYKGKRYPFTVEVRDTQGPELEVQDVTVNTNQNITPQDFVVSATDPSNYTLKITGDDPSGKAGEYTIQVTARDDYDNTTTKTAHLSRFEDKKAPTIEDFSSTLTIKQGHSYPYNSIVVKDDHDSEPVISADTTALNTDTPGNYPVKLTVTDSSGNTNTYEQTVTVIEDQDFGKKICYLTFDDGPSSVTESILQTLKDNDVKATFFVTGANPDYYPVMKEITDDGHTIALHTFSHNYDSIYASEEAYFADLQQISDLVKSETGVTSKIIRFPGGASNMVSAFNPGIMSRLVNQVEQKGYAYFDWNADSGDASGNDVDPAVLVENSKAAIGPDEVVLLLHDSPTKSTTEQALPEIIKAYRDAGYEFHALEQDTEPVHHSVNN